MDFSQFLVQETDKIIESGIEAVRQDRLIQSADELSRNAIQDHLRNVHRSNSNRAFTISSQQKLPDNIVYCVMSVFFALDTKLSKKKPAAK